MKRRTPNDARRTTHAARRPPRASILPALSIAGLPHTACAVAAEPGQQFSNLHRPSRRVTSTAMAHIGTETELQDARLNKAHQALSAKL